MKHFPKGVRVLLLSIGSVAGVVVLALAAVLTVGGILSPAHYLEPWERDYADRFDDPRVKVVAQAELAPSGHNMQPWSVALDARDTDVLYLFADATRLSPAVDPVARQTMVSQGSFLHYLRVSASELGYSTQFDLFPDGTYDESELTSSMTALPVAKITMTEDAAAATPDYASLFLSDTNRSPYVDVPVPAADVDILTGLADDSGAAIDIVTDADNLAVLGDLAMRGTRIESEYAPATAETDAVFHTTEGSKNKSRSGFAVEGQGTTGFMKYLLQGMITIVPALNDDESAARTAIESTDAAVAHTPAYAMISTSSNSRVEQVEAGMLYAEMSLRARTLGLVTQPLSQVLQEYPTMAGPYAEIHEQYANAGQTIEMLVRIGAPTTEYPTTMRRDVSSIVRTP